MPKVLPYMWFICGWVHVHKWWKWERAAYHMVNAFYNWKYNNKSVWMSMIYIQQHIGGSWPQWFHHLNGQVGWVSLHLLSLLLLLLPCWRSLPFWTCFDTIPSPCMDEGSRPASQEGLGQLRGAAQLTMSQLSSAPLQSPVHHCIHHCTDCAGGQWQRQHKWQDN